MPSFIRWMLVLQAIGFLARPPSTYAQSTRPSPTFDAETFAAIDAYVTEQLDEADIPGAAIVVVDSSRIMFARGYGRATPGGVPVTPQTPFVLGSVSKPITAMAVVQLEQAGHIELDAPLQRYVPWFRVADGQASGQITVRHLLAHTSGFSARDGLQFFGESDTSAQAIEQASRALHDAELLTAPGAAYHYSNANYLLLGALIEAVTGAPYERYIEQHVFAPLGMTNSYASIPEARTQGLATGHRYLFGQLTPARELPYTRANVPLGLLVASAEDLGHFVITLLNNGTLGTAQVLDEQYAAELFQPHASVDASRSYALGWFIEDGSDYRFAFHGGSTENFSAYVARGLDETWGVVVLVNAMAYTSGPQTRTMQEGVQHLLMGTNAGPVPQAGYVGVLIVLGLILALQAVAALHTVYMLRQWRRFPEQRPHRPWQRWGWHVVLPLVGHLTLVYLMLVVLPYVFELTLSGMLAFAPDAGYLAVASAGFALAWGIVRTLWTIRASAPASLHSAQAA